MPLFGPKTRQKTQVNQGQNGFKIRVFSVNSCVVLKKRVFFYVAFSLYLKRMKIRHMFTLKKRSEKEPAAGLWLNIHAFILFWRINFSHSFLDKSAENEIRDFYAHMALTHERRFARCFCRYSGNIAMRYFLHNKIGISSNKVFQTVSSSIFPYACT